MLKCILIHIFENMFDFIYILFAGGGFGGGGLGIDQKLKCIHIYIYLVESRKSYCCPLQVNN